MNRPDAFISRLLPLAVVLLTLVAASGYAQETDTTGVSKALALDRATRLSDLRYSLDLKLAPHADQMKATEVLQFTLGDDRPPSDLLLDFRDGTLTSVQVNGSSTAVDLAKGHLRLPARSLKPGKNRVDLQFASRIAAAGAAITRYDDKEDGSEYIYSLFVPMDASMAFPCFDQPDLKARFTLSAEAPATWSVLSNTRGSAQPAGERKIWRFPETKPISTYLFAFAAGPWSRFQGQPGEPDVYVRSSQQKRAQPEMPQLQHITAQGISWLAQYFQQPFPFPKYDLVLIPGFPFGGMEHAGATFLREDGVLFRSAPTANDRFNRDILTLHELTHQWFGDLVTMRWFDDLWLKEGFAQYMAYRAVDALEPQTQPWKHFYESIKPQAYGIDETPGTTPIFQNIPNLRDAKSAYGAIVYQKAPAILKQLEFRLGPEGFRDGLRLYLKRHAYGNAQWSDLIEAFHQASGRDVRTWADAWVLRRGMPEVNVAWSCNVLHRITRLTLTQHDVLSEDFIWPISNEVLLDYAAQGRSPRIFRADWSTPEYTMKDAVGAPCPDQVFANADDQAYGRFLLDPKSEEFLRQSILNDSLPSTSANALHRSMLWGALWDNVHVAHSSPRSYVELALHALPREQDETLAAIQAGHATSALHFYMTAPGRGALVPQLEQISTDRMRTASTAGLRIVSFRTLVGIAETGPARNTLKDLLFGKISVPGVDLRPLDRWNLIGKLVSLNDPDASTLFNAETERDHTDDGQKYAWAVQAGVPTASAKETYFAEYLRSPSSSQAKPEDWLTQSLRPFNSWNQASLTEPYVSRALNQLPEIKHDRKIFFLGAWLNAFIGGQNSPEAEQAVQTWLAQPEIDPDLRLKVLEANDELARTVRIRAAFPD